MATDLRRHLASGREQLATDVERMRGMMHDDYVGARKTLKSFNATMREHRIRGGSATPAHKTSAAPPAVERASAPDDLTTISGIGVSRQRLLNQAGIRTFAQLAHRSPDQLMAVLGSSAHLANVKQWIAEAKLKM
jgi:predicted flap endonuclease-1-like 5' DNA nuclease